MYFLCYCYSARAKSNKLTLCKLYPETDNCLEHFIIDIQYQKKLYISFVVVNWGIPEVNQLWQNYSSEIAFF